jgi:uncharacterized membrane protein (DUF2068 family)
MADNPSPARSGGRSDIVMRLIAVERLARGLVLLAVGAVLALRTHTDWAARLRDWARDLGLDPSRHVVVARLINRAAALTPHQLLVIGIGAMAYGALALVEGAGLWRRRRWAEYLTVIATAVFVPLEVWELAHRPSLLKAGGLVVNLLVVAYLIVMLRRRARSGVADGRP